MITPYATFRLQRDISLQLFLIIDSGFQYIDFQNIGYEDGQKQHIRSLPISVIMLQKQGYSLHGL